VQSYRDLPILMNQWSNVMRWELRTRLFLRTSEFLWQEGHTAHATADEAQAETLQMLGVYRTFMEDWVAMPPVTGFKSESEKFAGAVHSVACEALMQDNKALQAGTSHFLGQNFSKQFDLKFQSEAGQEEYAWNTSWGVSTRLVGGMVMTHGDDVGIIVPPKLAPSQVVIVPISRKEEERVAVKEKADQLAAQLKDLGVRVKVDGRDHLSPGAKFWEWERKGVPFRLEVGPKDLAKEQAVLVRRKTFGDEDRKEFLPEADAVGGMSDRLDVFQASLLQAARDRREANSHRGVNTLEELQEIMEGDGGFVYAGWNGDPKVEDMVKEKTKATIRVIPDPEFKTGDPPRKCIGGGDAKMEVVFAKAY
ncbi:MAG: proline--tRNA ligase, partial [Gemmatimonadetes bacterium]|nr:proline--tRNA ligase [Gemmatimonadota bacterium]